MGGHQRHRQVQCLLADCWLALLSSSAGHYTTRSGVLPGRVFFMNNEKVVETLNRILELELAGVVRYLHYSFMIFGHTRIPIVGWLRGQAAESQAHAVLAGEHITAFGGHPSLEIGGLLETHKHNVDEIMGEALAHE